MPDTSSPSEEPKTPPVQPEAGAAAAPDVEPISAPATGSEEVAAVPEASAPEETLTLPEYKKRLGAARVAKRAVVDGVQALQGTPEHAAFVAEVTAFVDDKTLAPHVSERSNLAKLKAFEAAIAQFQERLSHIESAGSAEPDTTETEEHARVIEQALRRLRIEVQRIVNGTKELGDLARELQKEAIDAMVALKGDIDGTNAAEATADHMESLTLRFDTLANQITLVEQKIEDVQQGGVSDGRPAKPPRPSPENIARVARGEAPVVEESAEPLDPTEALMQQRAERRTGKWWRPARSSRSLYEGDIIWYSKSPGERAHKCSIAGVDPDVGMVTLEVLSGRKEERGQSIFLTSEEEFNGIRNIDEGYLFSVVLEHINKKLEEDATLKSIDWKKLSNEMGVAYRDMGRVAEKMVALGLLQGELTDGELGLDVRHVDIHLQIDTDLDFYVGRDDHGRYIIKQDDFKNLQEFLETYTSEENVAKLNDALGLEGSDQIDGPTLLAYIEKQPFWNKQQYDRQTRKREQKVESTQTYAEMGTMPEVGTVVMYQPEKKGAPEGTPYACKVEAINDGAYVLEPLAKGNRKPLAMKPETLGKRIRPSEGIEGVPILEKVQKDMKRVLGFLAEQGAGKAFTFKKISSALKFGGKDLGFAIDAGQSLGLITRTRTPGKEHDVYSVGAEALESAKGAVDGSVSVEELYEQKTDVLVGETNTVFLRALLDQLKRRGPGATFTRRDIEKMAGVRSGAVGGYERVLHHLGVVTTALVEKRGRGGRTRKIREYTITDRIAVVDLPEEKEEDIQALEAEREARLDGKFTRAVRGLQVMVRNQIAQTPDGQHPKRTTLKLVELNDAFRLGKDSRIVADMLVHVGLLKKKQGAFELHNNNILKVGAEGDAMSHDAVVAERDRVLDARVTMRAAYNKLLEQIQALDPKEKTFSVSVTRLTKRMSGKNPREKQHKAEAILDLLKFRGILSFRKKTKEGDNITYQYSVGREALEETTPLEIKQIDNRQVGFGVKEGMLFIPDPEDKTKQIHIKVPEFSLLGKLKFERDRFSKQRHRFRLDYGECALQIVFVKETKKAVGIMTVEGEDVSLQVPGDSIESIFAKFEEVVNDYVIPAFERKQVEADGQAVDMPYMFDGLDGNYDGPIKEDLPHGYGTFTANTSTGDISYAVLCSGLFEHGELKEGDIERIATGPDGVLIYTAEVHGGEVGRTWKATFQDGTAQPDVVWNADTGVFETSGVQDEASLYGEETAEEARQEEVVKPEGQVRMEDRIGKLRQGIYALVRDKQDAGAAGDTEKETKLGATIATWRGRLKKQIDDLFGTYGVQDREHGVDEPGPKYDEKAGRVLTPDEEADAAASGTTAGAGASAAGPAGAGGMADGGRGAGLGGPAGGASPDASSAQAPASLHDALVLALGTPADGADAAGLPAPRTTRAAGKAIPLRGPDTGGTAIPLGGPDVATAGLPASVEAGGALVHAGAASGTAVEAGTSADVAEPVLDDAYWAEQIGVRYIMEDGTSAADTKKEWFVRETTDTHVILEDPASDDRSVMPIPKDHWRGLLQDTQADGYRLIPINETPVLKDGSETTEPTFNDEYWSGTVGQTFYNKQRAIPMMVEKVEGPRLIVSVPQGGLGTLGMMIPIPKTVWEENVRSGIFEARDSAPASDEVHPADVADPVLNEAYWTGQKGKHYIFDDGSGIRVKYIVGDHNSTQVILKSESANLEFPLAKDEWSAMLAGTHDRGFTLVPVAPEQPTPAPEQTPAAAPAAEAPAPAAVEHHVDVVEEAWESLKGRQFRLSHDSQEGDGMVITVTDVEGDKVYVSLPTQREDEGRPYMTRSHWTALEANDHKTGYKLEPVAPGSNTDETTPPLAIEEGNDWWSEIVGKEFKFVQQAEGVDTTLRVVDGQGDTLVCETFNEDGTSSSFFVARDEWEQWLRQGVLTAPDAEAAPTSEEGRDHQDWIDLIGKKFRFVDDFEGVDTTLEVMNIHDNEVEFDIRQDDGTHTTKYVAKDQWEFWEREGVLTAPDAAEPPPEPQPEARPELAEQKEIIDIPEQVIWGMIGSKIGKVVDILVEPSRTSEAQIYIQHIFADNAKELEDALRPFGHTLDEFLTSWQEEQHLLFLNALSSWVEFERRKEDEESLRMRDKLHLGQRAKKVLAEVVPLVAFTAGAGAIAGAVSTGAVLPAAVGAGTLGRYIKRKVKSVRDWTRGVSDSVDQTIAQRKEAAIEEQRKTEQFKQRLSKRLRGKDKTGRRRKDASVSDLPLALSAMLSQSLRDSSHAVLEREQQQEPPERQANAELLCDNMLRRIATEKAKALEDAKDNETEKKQAEMRAEHQAAKLDVVVNGLYATEATMVADILKKDPTILKMLSKIDAFKNMDFDAFIKNTDDPEKAKNAYKVFAGGVVAALGGTAIGVALQSSAALRMITGALAGGYVGMRYGHMRDRQAREKAFITDITETITTSEKALEQVDEGRAIDKQKKGQMLKMATELRMPLRLNILDTNPMLKSRALNVLRRIEDRLYGETRNATADALIAELDIQYTDLVSKEKELKESLEKGPGKAREIVFGATGAVAGAMLAFWGVERQHDAKMARMTVSKEQLEAYQAAHVAYMEQRDALIAAQTHAVEVPGGSASAELVMPPAEEVVVVAPAKPRFEVTEAFEQKHQLKGYQKVYLDHLAKSRPELFEDPAIADKLANSFDNNIKLRGIRDFKLTAFDGLLAQGHDDAALDMLKDENMNFMARRNLKAFGNVRDFDYDKFVDQYKRVVVDQQPLAGDPSPASMRRSLGKALQASGNKEIANAGMGGIKGDPYLHEDKTSLDKLRDKLLEKAPENTTYQVPQAEQAVQAPPLPVVERPPLVSGTDTFGNIEAKMDSENHVATLLDSDGRAVHIEGVASIHFDPDSQTYAVTPMDSDGGVYEYTEDALFGDQFFADDETVRALKANAAGVKSTLGDLGSELTKDKTIVTPPTQAEAAGLGALVGGGIAAGELANEQLDKFKDREIMQAERTRIARARNQKLEVPKDVASSDERFAKDGRMVFRYDAEGSIVEAVLERNTAYTGPAYVGEKMFRDPTLVDDIVANQGSAPHIFEALDGHLRIYEELRRAGELDTVPGLYIKEQIHKQMIHVSKELTPAPQEIFTDDKLRAFGFEVWALEEVVEIDEEEPPADEPPAEPPAEQPPAEQPPAEQPPAEQPPAEPPRLAQAA